MTDLELAKQMAIEQFIRRRRYASQIEKVDNAGLHAGSPMYFYCEYCSVPTEALPEDYLFKPSTKCSQCSGLEKEGWLEEAIRVAKEEW
jgi:hypothetical protein